MVDEVGGGRLFEVAELDEVPVVRAPAGAAKTFRAYDQDQVLLLPPSLDDWLPADHTARFISEIVDDSLDLGSIYSSYTNATGAPPFDPRMMLKLLLYAYSTGVMAPREVERRCHVDVAFRWLSANTAPDYRSLARFRRRHLDALGDLFTQVLVLCATAGLVKLGRVALDGTKLRASASRHKAMSYDRMSSRIPEVEAEVAAMLTEAEAVDAAEDDEFGPDCRGDELPAELATRERRLVKIRAAKAALEADAAQRAGEAAEVKARQSGKSDAEVDAAVESATSSAVVNPKAQRSFTDPDARMIETNDGFHYAYNAQAVADDHSQVVVAVHVTQHPTDVNQLLPMLAATRRSLDDAGIDTRPGVVLADAGYCSTANIDTAVVNGDNVLVRDGTLETS